MKRCKNYINGAWTESVSGNAAPTFNPATGEELAQVVVSTPEDVDRAVAAAHTSFYETREWRDMDSQTRGDFLLRIADLIAEAREELAYLDAVDMGKPLREEPLVPIYLVWTDEGWRREEVRTLIHYIRKFYMDR